jgi:hypothetical protein
MAFVVLLGLVACKDQSQSAQAPTAPPPPPPTVAPHNLKITVDGDNGNRFEVYSQPDPAITRTVTWQYGNQFYIHFKDNRSPCSNSDVNFSLTATITATGYTATCTLKQAIAHDFPYDIEPPPAPAPKGPPRSRRPPVRAITGHCEGCVINN